VVTPFRPIERPRVYERLLAAAEYRITTIVAPAGFGKSVALRQFVRRRPSCVLYEVARESKTLLQFVRGFCDAFASYRPGLRAALRTAFEGTATSSARGRDLGNWAAVHLRDLKATIVLDNLEVSNDDPEISQYLTTVIEHTRAQMHWLLASREPLALPIASWLAYHEAGIGLDQDDLRFTLDEARASATGAGISISEYDLATVFRLTGGWPAALTFAFWAAMKARDAQSLTDETREMVYQYLAEQVWSSLDAELQGFLAVAAFLPWIDQAFAEAFGGDQPARLIDRLRSRIGLLTTREVGVYELHDLFRTFIERTISNRSNIQVHDARLRAAQILENNNLYAEAIDAYVNAGAHDALARLLNERNVTLLDSGHYDVAMRALRNIRPSSFRLAGVLYLKAAIEESQGHIRRAEALYARALSKAPDNVSLRASISCRYSLLLYQQGRTDGIALLDELAGRSDLSESDRTDVTGSLAVLAAYLGDQARATALMDSALALAETADDQLRARTYGRASTVSFFAGDEEALQGFASEAAHIAESCSLYSLAARVYTSLSAQYTAAGRIGLASAYAERIVASAEKAGDPQLRARGLGELMALEAELGNEDRLLSAEKELGAIGYHGPNGLFGLLVARAMSLLWNARFEDAADFLSRVREGSLPWHQHRVQTSLLAVAYAASGNQSLALRALAAYDLCVSRDTDTHTVFVRPRELGLRYAILAALILGERSIARRLKLKAPPVDANFSSFEGFDDALSALRCHSRRKLEAALASMRTASQSGIARLIAATTLTSFDVDITPEVRLTAAEAAILRSLAEGLTNKAIADAQGRTVNTIRTHVASILRKLRCETRGEAVAAARRVGYV
jgi:ATP/maltotriose-dependent transcriptional regulator MalT